jgi:ATP-dependent DNA helicase RecG
VIDIQTIADVTLLRESCDLECKLAAGRDGHGAVPDDFWPTYSAFANTEGGVVVLGLREKHEQFTVHGIARVAKVRKELFDALNNRNKVSVNLLGDSNVREVRIDGSTLLVIEVPRASRKQRPVHLTTNPFAGNTYRRLNDGDRPVPDDDVRRMIAEQVEDSRDSRILNGYGLDDLCLDTFRAYRQVFANRDPAHPWNTLEDVAFLRQLGGWRHDRETEESGLTVAGLLMFGWMTTIQEALPNYMLDYQERPEARIELRWADRLTLDGKWSGNLYDFYRKLTADLKVPFALERGQRQEETPVHVALREALANVLVHGDYSDRASVLVVKRPDMFGFRNPGLMRIPPEVAIRGGEHDCRNRTLHKMFRLVGVGEQAGSGIPKIYGGSASQPWRPPALYERSEPYNQTLLELRMVDLLPADLLAELRRAFGAGFDSLGRSERLTLAAASSEMVISHARVRELTGMHPFDTSRLLQSLVRDGFLDLHNPGRGAVYSIPGAAIPKPEEVFGAGSEHSPRSSEQLATSSEHLPATSTSLGEKRDLDGCLLSDQLDAPIVDSLSGLEPEFRKRLERLAAVPRSKAKIPPDAMREAILAVCAGHYVALSSVAELVDRDADALRQQHLKPLVKDGKLRLAFPTAPTHARQAYRAVDQ